jgi:transketolase
LIFSRQAIPHQKRGGQETKDINYGGYILQDCTEKPTLIIIATGSEVGICREAVEALQADGEQVRLVSMPSVDVFEEQDAEYRESVLPSSVRNRLAVEASAADYWYKLVGLDGKIMGMKSFGESAPGGVLMSHFGFSVDNVIETARSFS